MRMAAGVAYYFMLAIAPMLVVSVRVLHIIYGNEAEQRLKQQFDTLADPGHSTSPGQALKQLLQSAGSRHGWLALTISFTVALVSGSSLFACLQDHLNSIWDVKRSRRLGIRAIARNRLISGAMVFVVALLLLLSVATTAIFSGVVQELGAWGFSASWLGESLGSVITSAALFSIIYRLLPQVKLGWAEVFPGAILMATLFVVGKSAISIYFRFATLNAYGAAGSLAALLIWVYYNAMLVFLGASFTRVRLEQMGKRIEPDEFAERALRR